MCPRSSSRLKFCYYGLLLLQLVLFGMSTHSYYFSVQVLSHSFRCSFQLLPLLLLSGPVLTHSFPHQFSVLRFSTEYNIIPKSPQKMSREDSSVLQLLQNILGTCQQDRKSTASHYKQTREHVWGAQTHTLTVHNSSHNFLVLPLFLFVLTTDYNSFDASHLFSL